ncbi:MAG TPA: gamma-glutamyl-gamma-aminobutyrate hydrolase family protein [Devosiaceae bacterium]|jgi:GMP synthase-like glutamine amidotransferase|nr:gamma-glutamyl-gamma-aminobutyrate hydrolase family protein [Devosiaceae bacterium]
MKLTIIQTGEVPEPLRPRFGPYPQMFHRMFEAADSGFAFETVPVHEGAPLPDPERLGGILITGSAAGVYEDLPWLEPLRGFIRRAYATQTPMLGVCFGHQVMADALGGEVRKSEKGWGLGRHSYRITRRPDLLEGDAPELAIACSHQDQVVTRPPESDVFLASDFTPNAGLLYRNGAAISLQPHPEFTDDYALALAELRRGRVPGNVVDAAIASLARPSDSVETARYLAAFLSRAA